MTDSKGSRRRATYDDVLRTPEHLVAELIDGELYTSPRPALGHALTSALIGDELISPFQKARGGPGGWWILPEPEVHLHADVLVPDWAAWHRTRMAAPSGPFATLAPDWVCEILSPSTANTDRVKKLHVYAREHIPYAWLVDPIAKTLEVLTLNGSKWTLRVTYGSHDRVRAVPFDAIEIELAHFWGETPTPTDTDR